MVQHSIFGWYLMLLCFVRVALEHARACADACFASKSGTLWAVQ